MELVRAELPEVLPVRSKICCMGRNMQLTLLANLVTRFSPRAHDRSLRPDEAAQFVIQLTMFCRMRRHIMNGEIIRPGADKCLLDIGPIIGPPRLSRLACWLSLRRVAGAAGAR